MPKTLPWPQNRKPSSKPLIGPPPEISSVAPRNTDMPPSVTTKGGTLALVMAVPWIAPPATPDQNGDEQRRAPAVAGRRLARRARNCRWCCPWPRWPRSSPQKASSEPIDRSMPAVRMTKVMPIASRPEIDTCRRTFSRLMVDRKRGSAMREAGHQHDQEDAAARISRRGRTSRCPGRAGRRLDWPGVTLIERRSSGRDGGAAGHQTHQPLLGRVGAQRARR